MAGQASILTREQSFGIHVGQGTLALAVVGKKLPTDGSGVFVANSF
jgi:hypothetical protein